MVAALRADRLGVALIHVAGDLELGAALLALEVIDGHGALPR
jgi:hypothetical protein